MNMGLLQKLGGVTQSIFVPLRFKGSAATAKVKSNILHLALIIVLLAVMFETSLAEPPQNNIEGGDHGAANAFGEMPDGHGPVAPPDGVTADRAPQPPRPAPLSDNIVPKPNEGKPNDGKPNHEMPNSGDIVIQFLDGRGFASRDNETNALMVNVDLIKNVDPAYLRHLMTSNMSIENIRDELRAAAGATATQGSLEINEVNYPLKNIELLPSKDNSTTIDADVAELHLKKDDTIDNITTVGHIKITLAASGKSFVGRGELTMSSDEYSGKYNVLLNIEKSPTDNIPLAQGNLVPPD